MMIAWIRSAALVALATLSAIASAEVITAINVDECGSMEEIELRMVKPQIANCEATSPFSKITRSSSSDARAAICADKTPCGKLLPYLAYMKKNLCKERLQFTTFADELLARCDDFPYKNIDPKWILVGKPPRPSYKEALSVGL